ncbi:MAG: hypothetical protein EXS64_07990 [Candidatus Latescibacteria bacterium]|nr:hypothetical protein [Candidatus Latescibacterota bacterium]
MVQDGEPQRHAKELRTPLVATNRCGFSYHHFQEGGTCIVAEDGRVVAKANEEGREEMIFVELEQLKRQ